MWQPERAGVGCEGGGRGWRRRCRAVEGELARMLGQDGSRLGREIRGTPEHEPEVATSHQLPGDLRRELLDRGQREFAAVTPPQGLRNFGTDRRHPGQERVILAG